jgi:hypothetical protein
MWNPPVCNAYTPIFTKCWGDRCIMPTVTGWKYYSMLLLQISFREVEWIGYHQPPHAKMAYNNIIIGAIKFLLVHFQADVTDNGNYR